MKTRDLKSLSETIASVVDPLDKERAQMLQEGFLNSLTEKARQIASKKMEDEDEEEEEDEMEDEGEEEEEKPSSKKKAKMMNEEVELAEKAAPGYEDWASDPKVKASFKKQYGKRWKEVMYGHSWNLAKQEKKVGLDEEDLGLEEGYQAKRMRVIRKAIAKKDEQGLKPEVADFMKRSFKKKTARSERITGGKGAVADLHARAAKKHAAMKAKGLAEGLSEEWGGGFQSYKDAQREVQAGLRRDAAIDRKTKINDIKAVLAGKMSKKAFTIKHKTKFSEHPLTRKIVAARINRAKARRLAESEQLDEISDTLLFRARAKAKGVGKFKVRTNPSFAGSSKDVPLHKKITQELQRRGSVPVSESEQLDELSDNLLFSARYKAYKRGKTRLTSKIDNELIKRKLLHPPTTSMRERENQYMAHRDANRARLKAQGMQAESTQLDEAGYKRLGRIKGAAYKAELASRGADPNTSMNALMKTSKLKRAAAELTDKVAAGMARRGGASQEAVRGGGSGIGKKGKYTKKAGKLANMRDRAIAAFHARARYNKAQGMSKSSTEKQISRNTQQFQDDIRNRSRSGDFGQDNQAALRARSNFQKRFGRLKGK